MDVFGATKRRGVAGYPPEGVAASCFFRLSVTFVPSQMNSDRCGYSMWTSSTYLFLRPVHCTENVTMGGVSGDVFGPPQEGRHCCQQCGLMKTGVRSKVIRYF